MAEQNYQDDLQAELVDQLKQLVQEGNLPAVTDWIRARKPILCPGPGRKSVLELAARRGFRSMVEVLVAQWTDKETLDKSLRQAVLGKTGAGVSIVRMLLEKGANPNAVDLYHVAESYRPAMMELFLTNGVDITSDDNLAQAIAAEVRPLVGVYRQYRPQLPGCDEQLAKALRYFVKKGNLKWVRLAVWMGADPRRPVASLGDRKEQARPEFWSSAMEDAFFSGSPAVTRALNPDPARDNLSELLSHRYELDSLDFVDFALRLGANLNNKKNGGSALLEHSFWRLDWIGNPLAGGKLGCVYNSTHWEISEGLIERGAKLVLDPQDRYTFRRIRESLCHLSGRDCLSALAKLTAATDRETVVGLADNKKVLDHVGLTRLRLMRWLNLADPADMEKPASPPDPPAAAAKPPCRPPPVRAGTADRVSVTRQELYEELWTTPTSKVARKYGLSDVALAKICRKHQIPKPPRGYWAKLAVGQKVTRPQLPDQTGDSPIQLGPYVRFAYRALAADIATTPTPESAANTKPSPTIQIPQHLVDPHPVIQRTKEMLQTTARKDSEGRYWTEPALEPVIRLAVSKEQQERALIILDTLLKELEQKGFTIAGKDITPKYATCQALGTSIAFSFEEMAESPEDIPLVRLKPSPGFSGYGDCAPKAAGRLCFHLENLWGPCRGLRKSWRDGKIQRLDELLDDIVQAFVTVGRLMKERHDEEKKREAERAAAAKQREEQDRAWREEMARVQELKDDAERWNRCRMIRRYIAAAKKAFLAKRGKIVPGSDFANWLKWSTKQGNLMDPLVKPHAEQ